MKDSRWYEIDGETAYVYDSPYPGRSLTVSIIKASDLSYYRSKFNLKKIIEVEPEIYLTYF